MPNLASPEHGVEFDCRSAAKRCKPRSISAAGRGRQNRLNPLITNKSRRREGAFRERKRFFPLSTAESGRAGKSGAERYSRLGLAVRGVEAGENLGAGAELGLAEPVERCLDGVEELVHVAGSGSTNKSPVTTSPSAWRCCR